MDQDPAPEPLSPITSPTALFRDRSRGLKAVGAVEILIALAFAGIWVCAWLLPRVSPTTRLGIEIPGVGSGVATFYALAAGFFSVVGAGTMLARRWARSIMLAVSWLWLVLGTAGFTAWFLVMMPRFDAMVLERSPQVTPDLLVRLKIFATVVLGGISLLMPTVFLLFYRRPGVKETCEFKDARERWTDKTPLSVLALGGTLSMGSISSLALLAYGSVLPLFGTILSGPQGTIVIVAIAILLLLLAWGVCKLKPAAWWIALILGMAGSASNFFNLGQLDWADLLSKTGLSAQQIEMMKRNDLLSAGAIPGVIAALSAAYLGFVVYLWKYFKPKVEGEPDLVETGDGGPETGATKIEGQA